MPFRQARRKSRGARDCDGGGGGDDDDDDDDDGIFEGCV